MNTNSTDFACLVTGFLTDYLPHHRCYSRNTILSYRDTLKLFLRFLKEEKETSPNSFYIKDFKRELVIEFLEWYRNNGAGITAANQRLAALKAFSDYAQLEHIEYIAPLQNVSGIRAKKAAPKEVSFLTVEQMSSLINSPDVNSHTGKGPRIHDFRHTYCVNLLRKWADEGKDLIAYLPYMRTMLGHESFEETAYYLKLTAERFPYIKERMKESFPDLIKEAEINEHEFY